MAETEAVNDEKLAEPVKTVPDGKKPWELRFEEDHPDKVEAEKQPDKSKQPEKTVKVEEQKEEAEDKDDKSATEEQTAELEVKPAQEQPDNGKAKPDPKVDEDKAKLDEAYLSWYAKKEGMTVEEAKDDLEKTKGILNKYSKDGEDKFGTIEEVAKAYRNSQSEYMKLKASVEATQAATLAHKVKVNPKAYINAEIERIGHDKLVGEYRKEYPAISRDMDDEQVIEKVRELAVVHVNRQIEAVEVKTRTEATSRREDLLTTLKENERSFYSDIKPVLDKIPDGQVIAPDFNFNDLIHWAKGKHADKLIRQAEEQGYQRGLKQSQQAKIVGQISKTSPAVKAEATAKASSASSLNRWQKDRALQMFASANMTDDEKFDAFLELEKQREAKRNKNKQ